MSLYDVLMRGFKDNTLTYDERRFLMTLSVQIAILGGRAFETEIQECSRPFDYGVLPRFEPHLIRMLERGCAQYLQLCGEILETSEFDAIRKKYRLTMPKMSGTITYPYLRLTWGYLEAERTLHGLKFTEGTGQSAWMMKKWKGQAFMRIKNRKSPMQHRDPMFPWRMYENIWDLKRVVESVLIERRRVSFHGETKRVTKVLNMSSKTKQAAVRMLLCAVAILDAYRRRAIAGEFTSKDTTVYLNKAWMHEIEGTEWETDKRKYCG